MDRLCVFEFEVYCDPPKLNELARVDGVTDQSRRALIVSTKWPELTMLHGIVELNWRVGRICGSSGTQKVVDWVDMDQSGEVRILRKHTDGYPLAMTVVPDLFLHVRRSSTVYLYSPVDIVLWWNSRELRMGWPGKENGIPRLVFEDLELKMAASY